MKTNGAEAEGNVFVVLQVEMEKLEEWLHVLCAEVMKKKVCVSLVEEGWTEGAEPRRRMVRTISRRRSSMAMICVIL